MFSFHIIIIYILCISYSYAQSQFFEDITARKDLLNEADTAGQKHQTRIEQSKNAMSNFLNRKKHLETLDEPEEERMQNLRFLPDPQENNVKSTGGAYGFHHDTSKSPGLSQEVGTVSRDPEDDRQVVAGIPDMMDDAIYSGDPCFRRYANCIVVNAQPYERRSSTSLIKCKSHCLHSQTGVYSCRSFVYDNINQVCDLFAHVGDQSPARLLKFQTRDYFEPTSAVQCLNVNETPEIAALASHTDQRKIEDEKVKIQPDQLITQQTSLDDAFGQQCASGKKAGFLRTEGFELFKNDDITMTITDVNECISVCQSNLIDNQPFDCRSFDQQLNSCSFTKEAAVPVGEGQLKQKTGSFYYEKICISEKFASQCTSAFARYPQMILVGFAENVADSASFELCFDSCLNSLELYGFNCTSGMYYFEESTLNCILNSENRHSYPDLFTEENTDIVDYFEIDCGRTSPSRASGIRVLDENRSEKLVLADETETEWTDCDDGIQHRRRDCDKEKINCGLESRSCDHSSRNSKRSTASTSVSSESTSSPTLKDTSESLQLPKREDILALKKRLLTTGFNCPENHCCNVFNMCSVGLRHNSHTKQLEYCKNPCSQKKKL